MKNWITIALLAGVSTIYAQKLDEYQYFHISNQTSDFNNNQFQLQTRLNFYLGKKDYTILSQDKSTWPSQASMNPCNVVNVDLEKGKSMLTNKLEIVFKDCRNNVIEKFEGKSNIKEFEKGYQDALLKALANIKNHQFSGKNDNSNPGLTTIEAVNKVEPYPVVNDNSYKPIPTNQEGKKEPHPVIKDEVVYDNDLKKVDLKDGGFLLMNKSTMQTVAQFEPTLRPMIYRVTVIAKNGEKYPSIGFTEGNTISYEYIENNEWKVKTMKL